MLQKSVFEAPRTESAERVALLAAEFNALRNDHDAVLKKTALSNKQRDITIAMIESLEAEIKPLEEKRPAALDLSAAMELEGKIKAIGDKLAVAKSILDRLESTLYELNSEEQKIYNQCHEKRLVMLQAQGDHLLWTDQGQSALELLARYSALRREPFLFFSGRDHFPSEVKQAVRERIETFGAELVAANEI